MLNNNGPKIEPCETPDRIRSKQLLMLFILTHKKIKISINFDLLHKHAVWQ